MLFIHFSQIIYQPLSIRQEIDPETIPIRGFRPPTGNLVPSLPSLGYYIILGLKNQD